MFLFVALFGSNDEIAAVIEPIWSEEFIVWLAPVIGSVPETGTEVLIPVTAIVATSPVFGVAEMLPETVYVMDAPG